MSNEIEQFSHNLSNYIYFGGFQVLSFGISLPIFFIAITSASDGNDHLLTAIPCFVFFGVLWILGFFLTARREMIKEVISKYLRNLDKPLEMTVVASRMKRSVIQSQKALVGILTNQKIPGYIDLANGVFYPQKLVIISPNGDKDEH